MIKCRFRNAKQYLQKNTQCSLRFGSRFLTPKWGITIRLIYFCNNNGADSHFGSRFPAPKMGANFESFFSYFKIDVETKTSGPTLKIKPSHSSFQSFRTSRQPNILPQESSLLTKKTDWGGPFQWLQFCDKFQLPFLELLFSRSNFESKTK